MIARRITVCIAAGLMALLSIACFVAAAFVPVDSPLQTFPDVVTLFMEEHHDLPMRMPGEDLRLELRDVGMLENGEMIYALPKALNDYRFAWSNENKTVYVRGNK